MADRKQLLNDPETALRAALDGRQSTIWTALPGIVKAVNLSAMTLSVQPSIQGTIENEYGVKTLVNLPLLLDVPIVFQKAGGFLLTLPISIEDEVLVIFSSRCIDAWWQLGEIQRPLEARMHDLSDGFAIPGISSQPNVVSGISSTEAQLRTEDGSTFVAITADNKIKLTAASIEVTGNMTVAGNIGATGTVTSGAVSLSSHVHSGVTTGPSNTGLPT